MLTILFKDVKEGTIFTFNNNKYIKIEPEKVSCCTTLNASEVNDPNKKIMIKPITEVVIDE